jgi:hypothetical protein
MTMERGTRLSSMGPLRKVFRGSYRRARRRALDHAIRFVGKSPIARRSRDQINFIYCFRFRSSKPWLRARARIACSSVKLSGSIPCPKPVRGRRSKSPTPSATAICAASLSLMYWRPRSILLSFGGGMPDFSANCASLRPVRSRRSLTPRTKVSCALSINLFRPSARLPEEPTAPLVLNNSMGPQPFFQEIRAVTFRF